MTARHTLEFSENTLLGGRLRFQQPVRGYRTAIDPVLLAAWAAPVGGGLVLDLGCGTGAASLCLAWRRPDLRIEGIDRDEETLTLARSSAALNGVEGRVGFARRRLEDGLPPDRYDTIVTNPPYVAAGRGTRPPEAAKAGAHMESSVSLADWLHAALKTLKGKGRLFLVHRADRLDDILAALHGRAGSVTVLPLHPKAGRPATRVLLAAVKGGRGPLTLLPGIVLHQQDGSYGDAVERVLKDGEELKGGGVVSLD